MNQKVLHKFKTPRIKGLAIHPNKPLISLILYNGTYINYSTTDLKPTFTQKVSDLPLRCCMYFNNIFLIGCDDGFLYAFENDKLISKVNAHKDFVRRIAISNNNILTCSDDGLIKLWHLNDTFELKKTFEGHTHFVMDIKFHNEKLLSASLDGTVKIWDLNSKKELNTLIGHSDGVNSVAGCNNYIVSVSDDLTAKIWDNYKCIYTIRGHTKNINMVKCFDNFFITCSEDGYLKVYNKKSWKLEFNYNTNMERVWDVEIQNEKLFVACDEGMVVLSFGKKSFNILMSDNRIFYNENENLKMLKTDNLNFVKDLSFLEFVPEFLKVSGKFIALGYNEEFFIYNILGMRIKKKGKGSDFFFTENGYLCRNGNLIESESFKYKVNSDKLIGIKNDEIFCVNIKKNKNCTLLYKKEDLIFKSNSLYEKCLFYNDFIILIGDNFSIYEINFEVVNDFVDQGLEISEENLNLVFSSDRKIIDFYIKEDVFYYSVNNKLFYLFLGENISEYCYCVLNGKFVGVSDNFIYIFEDKKTVKKELSFDLMNWQRNVLIGKIDYNLNEEIRDNAVNYLIGLNMYNEALTLCKDENKRFELLVKLKRFEDAFLIANNNFRYKALMKEFLNIENYEKAGECALKGKDFNNLYLINSICGGFDKEIFDNCGSSNLEFLMGMKMKNYKRCFEIVKGSVYENVFKQSYLP